MKRRIGLILLLLVADAIVNVAVAWGCAMWSPIPGASSVRTVASDTRGWLRATPAGWPEPKFRAQNVVFGWSVFHQTATVSTDSIRIGEVYRFVQRIDRAGFPSYALESEYRSRMRKNAVSDREWLGDAGAAPRLLVAYDHRDRRLPLRLLWPGFAINTLFYAAIVWGLVAAPFALRRRRRVKRGLCPACAYPVGDSDVCTECGTPRTVKPKEMAA